MTKVSKRALSLLLIAALVLGGLGHFIYRDYYHGRDWATYFSIYNSGSEGEILDRNGVRLAWFNGGESAFIDDEAARIANYHVTGDYWGRTGTGLLSRYWSGSQNYDFVNGTTQETSSTLQLTVDSELNKKAFELLNNLGKGCIMMMNYRTGEVICMVSAPSIDPIGTYAEEEIPDGAYINRCLSAAFTPGSTFKLVTAAAAIENLPDVYDRTWLCEEEYKVAGVPITCTTAHGTQKFERALANSCNCAFAQIAVSLGQDTLIDYTRAYGFLDSQEINGIRTAAGNFPLEFVGDPETAWAGIGQSVDLVCPYTMMRYVAAIANGGTVAEPTLIKSSELPQMTAVLNGTTAKKLQSAMRNNVVTHYEGETLFPGLELCAKTGTAELGDGTSNSWFTGFLQDDAHPYAFVALVEGGGFGLWTAGLMMNELLQEAVR